MRFALLYQAKQALVHPHPLNTPRTSTMSKRKARDEDDQPQAPNAGGSVYEESGYPEEHSTRHGTEERDDGGKTVLDAGESADDQAAPPHKPGSRQQDEQQAYRRAGYGKNPR
jgi:hypothetical protein